MMLFNRDSAIQKCFQKILHSLQVRKFSSLSAVRTTCHPVQTPNYPKHHLSGRHGFPSGRASVKVSSVRTMRYFCPDSHQCLEASNSQDCILPDVMANHLDTLQSSRRSQCSNVSVRTTWLYRPDAIQCLTSIRVSDSRHSYGKTAATVRAMSSIRKECAYQVQPSGREPSWSGRSSFIYGNCVHQFNRPDDHPPGPDAPSLIMVITCS
jgi:hypothetical protein